MTKKNIFVYKLEFIEILSSPHHLSENLVRGSTPPPPPNCLGTSTKEKTVNLYSSLEIYLDQHTYILSDILYKTLIKSA